MDCRRCIYGTLGVATLSYLSWAILCWSVLFFAIIYGASGIGIAKLKINGIDMQNVQDQLVLIEAKYFSIRIKYNFIDMI